MTDVFDHPWLGALFGDPEVSALWSAETQLEHYRVFEAALATALEACGRIPPGRGRMAADAIERAELDIATLSLATARDGLPVPEFVRQLRMAAKQNEAAIHTGATSQDVLDTALALTLRDVSGVLIDRLQVLDASLSKLIAKQGSNVLIGRTRMQAALPITVSTRLESWRQPLKDHVTALEALRPRIERLQLGGAVGTRDGFGAEAERIASHMAATLDLAAEPVWHTDRIAVAEYAGRLSLVSGSLGKLGQDIALMAQQGIDEIVLQGGGGSSAMPHKSNPVLAELLVTLARFNATQIAGLHQSLIHEQERSGAAWMLEWMILPQMAVATARSLAAATALCSQIQRIGSKNTLK
ncbi:3-carboxy-cis,cis-muconate cycloisomerase [uncultured Ruegeria sp.]|uniref:3-carboxy-cis,cis-muconate cycloisomerase n=1 Tax=uncultured Ruegeria sp. TaxID=259304 RepID=UPI00262A7174|nr:3-carboxy-cis,cis-muconate cycloisomerase [uncultured Ruegeria sp.]